MIAPAPTVRIVGRYALYGAIASGGMATVFLGRLLGPVGFARTVAVKRLHPQFASDPEFVSMFLDEARLAARIRHPNVVPTLDIVATKGELFLVMDYVHGESLGKLIRAAQQHQAPIPVPVAAAILSGVLQGLHAAHEAKSERGVPLQIVHRDVSPQNILVGNDGQARVLDFGVARATGRAATTRDGQLKGKLAYMPPEQLRGEPVTPRTDVYAASVVLWEALTAHRLFRAENEVAIINKVLTGAIPSPSNALGLEQDHARRQAVAALDEVVMRGLARDPVERWSSALEMAHALEGAVVPATGAQVAQWVEGAARATLQERATLLAEIESNSAIDPTSANTALGMSSSSMYTVADDARARSDHTNLAPTVNDKAKSVQPPAPGVDVARTLHGDYAPEAAPSQAPGDSSYSSAALAASSLPSTRAGTFVALAAGLLGGLVLVGIAAVWVSSRAASPLAAPIASEPPSPSAVVPPPPAPLSPVVTASAASAPPATAEPEPARAPPAQRVVVKPAAPRAAPRPASSQPGGACDPPFTYDANGTKRYKDECF